MKHADSPEERLFLSPLFSVEFRSSSKLDWNLGVLQNYLILLWLTGTAVASFDSESHTLTPGETLLLNPQANLSLQAKGSVNFLLLLVSPSLLLDSAVRLRLHPTGTIVTFVDHVVVDSRLDRIGEDIALEIANDEPGRSALISSLVDQLVIQVLRKHSAVRRSDSLELSRVGLIDRRIRRAVELMYSNLDRELPLAEIASAAHLSPFHFSRLFKKLTGATPHAYLGTLRISRAKELLASTDFAITEVGARVGYTSSSHFTKAFREATGLSPRSFRAALVRIDTPK